jgi:hypothetical protein
MKKVIAALLLLLSIDHFSYATEAHKPVDIKLAKMIESVAVKTGLNINVNSSNITSLTINRINDQAVSDPLNFKNVKALQEAFDADSNIFENFGPAVNSVTDRSGKKRNVPENKSKHVDHIYISVRST